MQSTTKVLFVFLVSLKSGTIRSKAFNNDINTFLLNNHEISEMNSEIRVNENERASRSILGRDSSFSNTDDEEEVEGSGINPKTKTSKSGSTSSSSIKIEVTGSVGMPAFVLILVSVVTFCCVYHCCCGRKSTVNTK